MVGLPGISDLVGIDRLILVRLADSGNPDDAITFQAAARPEAGILSDASDADQRMAETTGLVSGSRRRSA
jgi:hypothetical protein